MPTSGSDKSVLFLLVYFPLLVVGNLLVWLALRAPGSQVADSYQRLGFLLLVAFVPTVLFTPLF